MEMKKFLKIVTAAALIVAVCLSAMLLSACSDGVTVPSEEEEKEWMQEQTELFSDVTLSGFEADTLDGEKADFNSCIKGYKVTMVNIWGTFCGPCIEEMPDLAKLYDSLPEGSNLITICTDAGENDKNMEFAREVVKDSKAGFTTLIPDKVIKKELTDRVTAFPTTIFVDENGKVIGEPHFGGHNEEAYRNAILEKLEIINSRTEDVQ